MEVRAFCFPLKQYLLDVICNFNEYFCTAVGKENSAKSVHDTDADSSGLDDITNQFWDKLQEQWSKMEQDHKWLSDFNDYADPFKVRLCS